MPRKTLMRAIFLCAVVFSAALPQTTTAEVVHSHAISVFGDVKYPYNFRHFDYVNPDAPRGGTIVLPAIGTFDNMNPYILKGRSASETNLLFDTLMANANDETATSYGLVAQSVEYDTDNQWIIFHLRPQAKFSDGSPITAEDVVFTYDTLKEKGHPIYKLFYADIGKATALGKRSVKFEITKPENREAKLLLGQLPVLSKKYYENVTFDKTTTVAPLGSGPYIVGKVDQGRSHTYKRNPDYWAKDLPVNVGRYNFDRIRYEYYFDTNVAIQAFKSGAVDLRYENIAKHWANSYNIPQVRNGQIIKEMIPHEIPQGMQAFALNMRREKFQDIRVRKALTLALDFEWMNKNVFYNAYLRSDSFFSNSIYAAKGLPEGRELTILEKYRGQIPDEVFTTPYSLPESDGKGHIRERLIEARALLEEAGWKIKNGRLTNDKGEVLTVEFLMDQGSTFQRIWPALNENFRILGIRGRLREVDTTQYQKLVEQFNFDMIVASWPVSLSPGTELVNYWHSSSADIPGSRNLSGVKDKTIDSLIGRILRANNKDSLVASVRALDRVLLWNYYVIPQWYIGSFRILYWDKFARPETMPKYDVRFGLYNWWAK